MGELRVTRATGTELDSLAARLRRARLPDEDVHDGPGTFYLAREYDSGQAVGCGGFEVYGDQALLRSVVVDPPKRGQGYGRQLVESLLSELRRRDVSAVWLLTTRPGGFFERFGFERVDRAAAPEGIASTHQFTTACPDSATAMRLILDVSDA